MTIGELKQHLSKYPDTHVVMFENMDGGCDTIGRILEKRFTKQDLDLSWGGNYYESDDGIEGILLTPSST